MVKHFPDVLRDVVPHKFRGIGQRETPTVDVTRVDAILRLLRGKFNNGIRRDLLYHLQSDLDVHQTPLDAGQCDATITRHDLDTLDRDSSTDDHTRDASNPEFELNITRPRGGTRALHRPLEGA
jgi:hypothetical protein